MNEKDVRIGLDRYIAKEWADYSLELYKQPLTIEKKYDYLKCYLNQEISGAENSRKTSNQLKRLWLRSDDNYDSLREYASEIYSENPGINTSLLHFGMSLCTFPIFKITCEKIGDISRNTSYISKRTITSRVSESILTPTAIPRRVSRIIQTLADWEIILLHKNNVEINSMLVNDLSLMEWFLLIILQNKKNREIPYSQVSSQPELLGIHFPITRTDFRQTKYLGISNSTDYDSRIYIKESFYENFSSMEC